jgi:hypothetical protein
MLVSIAVVSAAVAWTGVRVATSVLGELPDVPRSAPYALAFLAAVLVSGGFTMRRRVQRWAPGRERVSPDLAVRLLALAKASAIAGAAVAGGYVGAAVYYAAGFEVPFRQTATWWSLGSALMAMVVIVAGLWLERECLIPPAPKDDAA